MSESNQTPATNTPAPAAQTAGAAPAPAPDAAPKDAPKEAAKEAPKEGKKNAHAVFLGNDIEIHSNRPAPDYNVYGAEAFEANDRRSSGKQIALLCDRAHVPRVTFGGSYKNIKHTSLQRLFDLGIVDWPDGRQYLAYVFEKPNGRKIMPTPDAKPQMIAEDRLVTAVIQPIVTLLAEMRNVDMVHGAINLENMYFVGPPGSETVLLGECLTSAASARQHPFYEPVERAMAQPMGRGPGLYKDDLYSFGMCLAMLARGENLMLGKSPREIIADKIENGSYGSIVGRDRMPPGISEFLRGVLNDDEQMRWDIDDAMRWLEVRRLQPKQPRPSPKAARAYHFMDHKFWDLRSTALAFTEHPAEAANEIESNQFSMWMTRNFDDKILEKRLEKIMETEKTAGRDRLVCYVAMALDPLAPFRFRKLSIFPGGLGEAMAEAFSRGEDMQVYGDIIQQQYLVSWIMQRRDDLADATNMLSQLEKCRNFLAQKIPGYGLERVLYTLNQEAACMSPLLRNYMVLSPGHLLQALDHMAKTGQQNDRILDRHMIAFISVREPKMIDPHLGHVISHDRGYQMVGITRTLAAIQKRFATGPMPNMANWLIAQMTPALERYIDRDLRRDMTKKLEKLKDNGDLNELLELVDNAAQIQEDSQRYIQARHEYINLQREKDALSGAVKGHKYFGYATGRQAAMLTSAALATTIIILYLVTHYAAGN